MDARPAGCEHDRKLSVRRGADALRVIRVRFDRRDPGPRSGNRGALLMSRRVDLSAAKSGKPRTDTKPPGPSQAIVMTDEGGRVTVWTAEASELTGLSAEEMIGQPAWEICTRILPSGRDPEAVRRRVRTMVEMTLSKGSLPGQSHSPFRLRRADGVDKTIEHDLSVIPTATGYSDGHRLTHPSASRYI
jgi:PAS domain S-box-containing protein